MAFLATLEAVRHRLEGNSPLTVPNVEALFRDWDRQVPDRLAGVSENARVDAFWRRSTFSRVATVEVPVLFFDATGQDFTRVYPSLTYDIVGTMPRYNEFVYQSSSYGGDRYEVPVRGSERTVTDDGEDLGKSARMVSTRAVEHPLDILVEVRAYAKDPILMALLEDHVYNTFEPRTFLRVPRRDGSYGSWDMLYQDSQDLDRRQAVRAGSPGVEREYGKSWTWKVEGYFDNTDRAKLVNLVQKRAILLKTEDGNGE